MISREKQIEFVRQIAHLRPGKFRLVFLPPHFANKIPISENEVAALISEAESIEKELRKKIMGFSEVKIPQKRFNRITLAISTFPDQPTYGPLNEKYFQNAHFDLMIYGSEENLLKSEIDIISGAFKKLMESNFKNKGAYPGKIMILEPVTGFIREERSGTGNVQILLLAA